MLDISLVTKIIKKLYRYAYSFQKLVYVKDILKTKCMYFMIKNEKMFDKYMTIWEKVSTIIQINKNELIYNKKYLKAEKGFNTNESFQCFYIPAIMFDSVYKKDGNYYPKVFLEKFIHNFFLKKYNRFWFLGLWKFLLKYKNFSSLECYYLKYGNFFRDFVS